MNEYLMEFKKLIKELRIHLVKNKKSLLAKGVPHELFKTASVGFQQNCLFPIRWSTPAQMDDNFISWGVYFPNNGLPAEQRIEGKRLPFLSKSEEKLIKNKKIRKAIFNIKIEVLDHLSNSEKICVNKIGDIIFSYLSIAQINQLNEIEFKYADANAEFTDALRDNLNYGDSSFVMELKNIGENSRNHVSFFEDTKDKLLKKKDCYGNFPGGIMSLFLLITDVLLEEETDILDSVYQLIKGSYKNFVDANGMIDIVYVRGESLWLKYQARLYEITGEFKHIRLFNSAPHYLDLYKMLEKRVRKKLGTDLCDYLNELDDLAYNESLQTLPDILPEKASSHTSVEKWSDVTITCTINMMSISAKNQSLKKISKVPNKSWNLAYALCQTDGQLSVSQCLRAGFSNMEAVKKQVQLINKMIKGKVLSQDKNPPVKWSSTTGIEARFITKPIDFSKGNGGESQYDDGKNYKENYRTVKV